MRLRPPRFRHHAEQLLYTVSDALLELRAALGWGFRHVGGPERVPLGPTDMAVVCLVRNGEGWLPTFLRHYRELGARHIYFLDNGSTDRTVEMALARDDVTVFASDLPFSRYQIAFRRWMLRHLTRGGWGYVCDIDELMVYPFCETLPLPRFLEYLNRHGYTGVVGQVLDMFPAEPLREIQGRHEEDIRERHRWYDLSNVRENEDPKWIDTNEVDDSLVKELKGGIRGEVFGTTWATLSKHALLRTDRGVKPFVTGAHFAAGARMADLTVAVRHYKFIGTFEEHTRRGVAEAQYYRGSRTYRRYLDVYENRPEVSLHSERAREYGGTRKLLEEGFLVASDRYRRWVARHAREETASSASRAP